MTAFTEPDMVLDIVVIWISAVQFGSTKFSCLCVSELHIYSGSSRPEEMCAETSRVSVWSTDATDRRQQNHHTQGRTSFSDGLMLIVAVRQFSSSFHLKPMERFLPSSAPEPQKALNGKLTYWLVDWGNGCWKLIFVWKLSWTMMNVYEQYQ